MSETELSLEIRHQGHCYIFNSKDTTGTQQSPLQGRAQKSPKKW